MAETPNPYKHRPGDERLVAQVEPCTLTEADEDDSDRFPFLDSHMVRHGCVLCATDLVHEHGHATEYQRGYRDALVWVATELERRAESRIV